VSQDQEKSKPDDFASPASRAYADAALAFSIGVLAYIVSAVLEIGHGWHGFVSDTDLGMHLEELPIAMFAAGLGFAWFAWRRWTESEAAAREAREANEKVSRQLERNRKIITELQDARLRAEELDRAKTRFLAHMSHELRTPLNAIIGFSELMALETFGPHGDPHYGEYADCIHSSGQHLLDLINDLLDLTRIESGDLTPYDSMAELGTIADDACHMLHNRAAEAGVDLIHDPAAIANAPVCVDTRMIRQVLINLIANAIRHTGRGGTVHVTAFEGAAGGAGLRVADTGEGMDAATVKRVQSGFAEVKSALQREHDGAGIGLPLSRAIMQAHGGELVINSTPGKGTTVDVILPARRMCAQTQTAPDAGSVSGRASGAAGSC